MKFINILQFITNFGDYWAETRSENVELSYSNIFANFEILIVNDKFLSKQNI